MAILDLEMPVLRGDDALPYLRRIAPTAMLTVFTARHLDAQSSQALLDSGAFSCHHKGGLTRLDELLRQDLARFRERAALGRHLS